MGQDKLRTSGLTSFSSAGRGELEGITQRIEAIFRLQATLLDPNRRNSTLGNSHPELCPELASGDEERQRRMTRISNLNRRLSARTLPYLIAQRGSVIDQLQLDVTKNVRSQGENSYFTERLLRTVDIQDGLRTMYEAQTESRLRGFDFPSPDVVMGKVKEETQELDEAFQQRSADPRHFSEELGDAFFALVNLARHTDRDTDTITKANARKYLLRCQQIERVLQGQQRRWEDLSPEEIKVLWKEAKKVT